MSELFQLDVAAEAAAQERLDSWKEIAAYLKRDVRTVQRWEKAEGLPVHRHLHRSRSSVYASKAALEAWRRQRSPQIHNEETFARFGDHCAGGKERIRLVVLPFQNLSSEPDQDCFSDGLTEEMISRLSCLLPDRLLVIARTTAMHYKGTTKRIDQIGRELDADFFLEGSVRRTLDHVRVTAQLIRASEQTHCWVENYDRVPDDSIEIQSDVAGRIARALELELLPALKGESRRRLRREPFRRSPISVAASSETFGVRGSPATRSPAASRR